MSYIALLIALAALGYTAYQQYMPAQTTTEVHREVSIMDPVNTAKDAVAAIQGNAAAALDELSAGTSGNETTLSSTLAVSPRLEKMLVAGGCFWCVEADLEKLPGVTSVVSGYAGGRMSNPTYQSYAHDGYREVVEVTYDTTIVTYEQVLIWTMKHMDPTDDDGSFGDRGEYYSPAFYYVTPTEKTIIENLIAEVDKNGPYQKPLGIDIEADSTFYPAEDYHQDYSKGTLSKLKYQYYRNASGRDKFIESVWGTDTGPTLPWRITAATTNNTTSKNMWENYVKPDKELLRTQMDATVFTVTQEEGTERSGTSPYDHNFEAGIYVDVLSGEPLFSSRDKFDSETGWPSFVRPISADAVTEHADNTFFSKRTEVRSKIADGHLGHVFTDGPADRGGLRYCLNGVALTFIPKADMEGKGYGAYLNNV